MLQINRFEVITRGFTQMEVLILWLWFQKWIKQDKGSNSKHNSRILATLTTTTQKRSCSNLTTLLPKLQISDDHSFSSVMQENRDWKPQRAIWRTHPDTYSEGGEGGDLIVLMYPLMASNVLLRRNLEIQRSDIDSLWRWITSFLLLLILAIRSMPALVSHAAAQVNPSELLAPPTPPLS